VPAAVLAAVHHAEVIAHRVGEPLGALVLALAVTVIEAALHLSLRMAGGSGMESLPRDTVYATVMIITTGVVGLCTLIGGLAHREQSFRVEGAGGGLAALIVLAVVTLVLPHFTITTSVGTYSRGQAIFAAIVSAAMWGIFVFVQTVRHRDYFLPHDDHSHPDDHAPPPLAPAGLGELCAARRRPRRGRGPREGAFAPAGKVRRGVSSAAERGSVGLIQPREARLQQAMKAHGYRSDRIVQRQASRRVPEPALVVVAR